MSSRLSKGLLTTAVGAVLSLATFGVTTLVQTWSSIDDRLGALEQDRSKWSVMAELEHRIQSLEVTARVHEAHVQRLLDRYFQGPQGSHLPAGPLAPVQKPAGLPLSRPAAEEAVIPLDPDRYRDLKSQRAPVKK